jgi:peptidoglycan/xylan/chitin deacetylase (PgdA/CDA1 family)
MRWWARRWLCAAASSVALSACSDSSGPVIRTPTTLVPSADSLSFSALGRTHQLFVTVLDQTGAEMTEVSLSYASSVPTVAGVSTTGVVIAVANGAAIVTVSSGTATADVHVAVEQAPATVEIQPDSVVLDDPGDSAPLVVSVSDAEGAPIAAPAIVWSSSDDGVVTVDASGRVEGVATGTAWVSAEADGVAAAVTVRVAPELTLVVAGPTSVSAEVATPLPLSVRVDDVLGSAYGGALVQWSTDAGSGAIASAIETRSDATGHAAAVWILGASAGAQTARAQLTSRGAVIEVVFVVTAQPGPAVSATLVADSVLLSARGETAFLAPGYLDAHGNPTAGGGVAWQARDPAVATVAADGLVTAQSAGTTYVVGSLGSEADSLLVTVVMRGAITITFDDGFRSAYDDAWPALQQLGLRANIAVNPAQVGFPAYMTKAELDEVHAAGFSIVSHSMTHDSLTTLTTGELDYELRASREWIDAQGYQGANVFIVPYHHWSVRERNAIASHYEAARGTSANAFVPDSLVAWRPSNPYELTGIDADQLPYTTQEGRDRLRALLQRAAGEGAFLDVFFHNIPPANVADLAATLAVIDEFGERVLPYRELYPRFARSVH